MNHEEEEDDPLYINRLDSLEPKNFQVGDLITLYNTPSKYKETVLVLSLPQKIQPFPDEVYYIFEAWSLTRNDKSSYSFYTWSNYWKLVQRL